jgi:hypothetical protein
VGWGFSEKSKKNKKEVGACFMLVIKGGIRKLQEDGDNIRNY